MTQRVQSIGGRAFFYERKDLDATKRCVMRKLGAQQLMFEGAGAPVRHTQVARVTTAHVCRVLAKRCKKWYDVARVVFHRQRTWDWVKCSLQHALPIFGKESAVRPMSIIQDTAGF